VSERCSYDYALVRVVPRVERGERMNVGVILFCPERAFLDARVELDEPRLLALMPTLSEAELEEIRGHLADIERIARGEPGAGPIGELPQAQRFHWLAAPRSTVVQPSPVHAGLTSDPAGALDTLFATLVRLPPSLQGE
jgi:hypothetical protein